MGDPLTLEEKLKDPEYNNGVKAVLILRELKIGISSFVEVRCREVQAAILHTVLTNLPPHTEVPVCTECTRATLNSKRPCPENVCPFILEEIKKIHKSNRIALSCTDVSAWTNTSGYWEIARTFMGKEQEDKKSTEAADTDCTGLLSIIINCMPIHKYLTTDMVATPTVFHEVKTLRNKVMHSTDSRLSAALLQDLIKACVQILDDPKTLAADKTAKDARERIKEIEGMLLTVSNVDYPFLLEVQENQRQKISEIKTNVAVLAGKQASQDKTMTDLAGKQASQDKHISDLARQQALQGNEWQLNKLEECKEEEEMDERRMSADKEADDSSKCSIHEAKKLLKDGERQGYVLKGKIVKTFSLLKRKMNRDDTKCLAPALLVQGKITDDQMEDVEESPKRRHAVEKLLKHVLGGDGETHRCFFSECEKRENIKDVCDTDLSEKEIWAFIGLELMDDGRCRRPPDETKLTFTEQQKCLLITALNYDLNSDVFNDTFLSRLCISVAEHTKVWNCEMGNEKRINKLIATMQECHHSVVSTMRESLISLNMKHIADRFEGPTVSVDQSSDTSPSAILKPENFFQCSLCLAQIDCRLNSISSGSITFHLTADSNKWNKLEEKCSSGTIRSLIAQLYQAWKGALGIGEYRIDVTIYTITHLGTKEAEKAFLHLSTDVDHAVTGSGDGNYQLDVRFNPMLDHYDILVEVLDVTRRLLKSLFENECLAYGDIEETLAIDSRSDQTEHLINKLIGHGQKCYNVLQEHLRVTDKDIFNLLQERDINLKREKFYAGTFVLHVTQTSSPAGENTTDNVTDTYMDIFNPTCHFQSKEETGQTLDTDSHDNHAEEERLKDETTLDQDDTWKAALVKAYASLMNEMPTEMAVCLTNLLLENKSISEDQSLIIKRCVFRRETVGNLLHCVLRGDQKTWSVFKSGLGSIPEDTTTTEQHEFLRLENLTFENGKRRHHQEPRLRLKECDVVTLTCNFLSNATAIDKLNDGLLSKFHFSRQEHEAILNCDRDILYRADLLISTMEQCSENIVEDFLSLLEDVELDDVVGQLKHHAAKERHEKRPVQQENMDTGSTSLKRKLPALRQYLVRKLGFYLDHTTGLGRIELVPRDSEAWTNLEKSGEIEDLVPLLYDNLLTHPLLQSSENRVLSLKIYMYDNHCRSRKFVSGRTAVLDLIETTDEDTTTSRHGLLIDERHNPIKMHEELLLEGIEIPSLLGDFKKEGVFGHLPDIEAAGIRSRSKEMRRFLRRLSPTGRKLYNVLLLNVKKNDPAIFHELGAREKLAAESREYFTAEVQATVIMQGDLERRTLQVNNPTFQFRLQDPQTGLLTQQTPREPSPSNQQAQQVLPEYPMTQKPREYQEQGEVSGAGPVSSGLDETTRLLLQGQNLLISTESLRMGELLGKGHFGSVFKGYLTLEEEKGETLVAVKTLHKDSPREIDVQAFTKEALIMKDFNNPNVLSLIGICLGIDDMPLVVLPFIKHGDLLSYIRDDTHNPTIKDLINFAIDIAEGMAYLSSLKFVHRDLAARNCMLDEEYRVKVADFGLSRDIYEKDYYTCDNKKTKLPVKWMAIESLEKGKYSTKSDVWSYGIVLWELLTRGVNPYPEVDNWDIVRYLKQGRRMPQPHYCPDPLYTIMCKCWMPNSHGRPTFADLVHEIRDMITMLEQAMGQCNDSANIQSTYVNMEKCTDYHYTEMLMPPPDSESERTSPASGPASPFRHSSTPSMEPDSSNPLSARVNKGRQCKEEEEMEERRMSAMEEADPQTGPQQTHREPSSSNLQAQTFLPEYSMTRKPRGICVIINIKNFTRHETRKGTDVDREKLKDCFEKLAFNVQIPKNDLTKTEMKKTLEDVAREDHNEYDCFVCCILTHGGMGYLLDSNSEQIHIKELTYEFQANRCRSLAGKPKLFFFQACRGNDKMRVTGAKIKTDSTPPLFETDGDGVPDEADFLFGYSTVPGYVSYRDKDSGSLYISKLVQMLDEHSQDHDLLSILTTVNAEVSKEDVNIDENTFKQVPEPANTLRKNVYFRKCSV